MQKDPSTRLTGFLNTPHIAVAAVKECESPLVLSLIQPGRGEASILQ